MNLERDVRWFAAAALGLAVVAVLDLPAVFAVAAVAAFAVVGRRLDHGGLIAALALALVWSNATIVIGDGLSLPAMVGLVPQTLLAVLLVWRVLRGERAIAATSAFRVLMLYGVALLLSGFGAEVTAPVVDHYANFLVEGLLLWFLVVNVVNDRRTLRRALVALVVVGGFLGLVTVHQFATDAFDREYAGFGQLDEDERELHEREPDYTPRLSASIGEKNRFAQVLVATLPIAIAVARLIRGRASFVPLACGALMVGGVAVSGSRGAAVGVVVAVGVLAFLRVVSRRALLAVAGAGLAVLLLLPGYRERLWSTASVATVDQGEEVDSSTLGRITENLAAVDMYLDHPLTGVGPGGYPLHYEEYAEHVGLNVRDGLREAHNLYLGTAAELGSLGLVALVGIFGLLLRDLWRARRALRRVAPDLAHVASGLFAAVIGYMVTGVFLHLSFERYMWLFLAIADATARVLRHAAESEVPVEREVLPVLAHRP